MTDTAQPPPDVCPACNHIHPPGEGSCPSCKACLYKNSSQLDEQGKELDPNHEFPIFRCTKCNKRIFWD
jgi:hypothetical protein